MRIKLTRPPVPSLWREDPFHGNFSLLAALVLFFANQCLAGDVHKLQVSDPILAVQIEASGGHLVGDYGSYRLYETASIRSEWPSTGLEVRDEYNSILLNAKPLDSTKPEIKALRKMVGDFAGKRMHLVHFRGPVRPEWRAQLLDSGVEIVDYIPHNSYLVYGDAPSIARLQAVAASAAHIQWEGAYLDEYKFHPRARPVDEFGNPREIGTDRFSIQLMADEAANSETLQLIDSIKLAPVDHQFDILHYRTIVVRVPASKLNQLAARPDVISIRAYDIPRKFDERQDQIIAGNLASGGPSGPGYLTWLTGIGFSQAQFTASGFGVDMSDSGLDNATATPGHFGLYPLGDTSKVSRVIYNRLVGRPNNPGSTLQGCDGHGTLNSHIVAGYDNATGFPHTDPGGYRYGLGVCPFVKVGSSVIFDPESFTSPNYTTLQTQAYDAGARVSNNSWGASTAGDYTADAQAYDALVRAAGNSAPGREMVIAFAAGNAGPGTQSVGSPGTAKNVITVGAAENVRSLTPANGGNNASGQDGCGVPDSNADKADDIAFFSSRGPCADGRMKPDLVAPGSHVTGGVAQSSPPPPQSGTGSAIACFDAGGVSGGVCALPGKGSIGSPNNFMPLGQQFYTISTGTSHSTPAVAGGCALIRQYFINNSNTPPSPAMTKAYLLNSARYLTGSSANDNLWSKNQGMGEMNLGTAFDGTSRILRDELGADIFTASGQTRVFSGAVADGSKPFRVTVAWTDAPGSTTGNAYKNNLDLTVTVGGNTYKGNVFSGAFSVTGGSADLKNNVESVFLPAGLSGSFQVTITATSINSIGVPNSTNGLLQDFALVVYNVANAATVVTQPTDVTAFQGDTATLSVGALGNLPIYYQWSYGGAPISGATASTLSLPNVTPSQAGIYSVVVSNSFGSSVSSNANLTVIPTVPLPVALNATQLVWTTTGNANWHGLTNVSHDGVAAGQSGPIVDSSASHLSTTVTGPGTLDFWWKVSSETNADSLSFSVGAVQQAAISGEVDWQHQTIYLGTGSQTLKWDYSKDATNSAGADSGWVDQVTYGPGPTAALIAVQPGSQYVLLGNPASFSVTGLGTPPLRYQWRLNGAPIPGATSSQFNVAQTMAANVGTYSVIVSNDYGRVTSGDAVLTLLSVAAWGNNDFNQSTLMPGLTNSVCIAAGGYHSLALRSDSTVYAWGDDFDGQTDVPPGLSNVVAIAGGGYHSLALRADGTVTAWGADYLGQTDVPPQATGIISISAGGWHNLALKGDGTVIAWGDDSSGQTDVPPGLSNVVAVAAGGEHSLALKSDGTVVGWGSNLAADGTQGGQANVPLGLAGVQALAAGGFHSVALLSDGTLAAWGDNGLGQTSIPDGLSNVVAIAAGGGHSVAVTLGGSVTAWGDNVFNQTVVGPSIKGAWAVSAGNYHSLALLGQPPSAPAMVNPNWKKRVFNVSVSTIPGKAYFLQYANTPTGGPWQPVSGALGVSGNGALRTLSDPGANSTVRYYRVRQQ
jgi:hypothetical protein